MKNYENVGGMFAQMLCHVMHVGAFSYKACEVTLSRLLSLLPLRCVAKSPHFGALDVNLPTEF